MKTEAEYPFTVEQFHALTEAQRQAVLAVADYMTSGKLEITDEGLSEALNLMKVCEGCVPFEEADENLLYAIRRKFAAVYRTALEISTAELKQCKWKPREHFNFCLVIEPSSEDTTQVAIVDFDKPICYLHEWSKAWHFNFQDLSALADEVLRVKAALVSKVEELNKAREIFVCLEGGVVHEIENLPDRIRVTVLDYDTEGVEKARIEPSPVDGQPCVINRW